ncbi:MAG: ATP-binding protein [Desulfuromonadales bacterium]|nr:ATP-binding protein [Desulfuromonadales bacterium]
MNAVPESIPLGGLSAEWARIELLTYCLGQERLGQMLSEQVLERLKDLQAQVDGLRQWTGDSPWARIADPHWDALTYDVIAMVLAPEIEPRLGWIYQQLQPGQTQPYPTLALVRELLALDEQESGDLFALLDESAPLRRSHLIYLEGPVPYQTLYPGAGVTARLMDWPQQVSAPPGAIRVEVDAAWDDLILPPERLQHLREFLYWVEQGRTVIDEWGGDHCGGPVALFAGPSGTGKTFAAAVIANTLGWPLYRVDLGCLVSKYIGETEKNLNRLFDAAHGQSMILQFDEADSLFSKRGEVKEARDRYANMEVSHLLSRIESHHGPVILTTNLRQHLDPAFARRFHVVVDFPRPDAEARALLWQRTLPPRAPREKDLDEAFLGRALTMSGGAIHNAAMHAAYLAAGRQQAIGLKHVALSVWRELGKDGRELNPQDLGALARWLPEEGL